MLDVNLSVENWDCGGDGVISESKLAEALEEADLLVHIGNEDASLNEGDIDSGLFEFADADEVQLIGRGEVFILLPITCGGI